ncbi:MAG TPA: hypothetical protein VK589_14565 [Chryseolinea sp.]|nr:hypothetical protein [Chryseolinea sp.]
MKNPLTIFSKVFRSTMDTIPLTGAVTLEFCYDHVNEDYPAFNPDELLLLQYGEFQPLRIQETE